MPTTLHNDQNTNTRRFRVSQRTLLARPAVLERNERVLPGCLGGGTSRQTGPYVHSRNPLVYGYKPALKRCRRIDCLFVRCTDTLYGPSLEVSECALAFNEPVGGVWASDNFEVVADLFARTSGGPARQ